MNPYLLVGGVPTLAALVLLAMYFAATARAEKAEGAVKAGQAALEACETARAELQSQISAAVNTARDATTREEAVIASLKTEVSGLEQDLETCGSHDAARERLNSVLADLSKARG